jgi:hypothetical protein
MMVAFNRGDSESSMSISSLASSKRGWSVYEDETDNDTDCILEHMSKNTSKSVSFSTIDIREYPLTVGDNPGCGRGVSDGICDYTFEDFPSHMMNILNDFSRVFIGTYID